VNSRGTRRFWTHYRRLPVDVRQLARKAYQLFRANPNHPSLHFKRIQGQEPVYSIRISLGFRAIGLVEGDEVNWIWIGSHAEYDELLKRKPRPEQ
jgi:hypothetical protein